MARKKSPKKYPLKVLEHPYFPTRERMSKGTVSIRGDLWQAEDPIRIDKLLRNGIIDEMQHLYGMQIITYWLIANRPFIRTASYEQRIGKTPGNSFEFLAISRMSAEDKFYKTMEFLNTRERSLITKICFEEAGAIEAGKSLGLPVNSITLYVRAAFDALGDALARMRKFKKEMEEPEKTES